ncbi:E3 ubiquitin-protein ligase parkin-like isoform X2 [Acropora muricata]|uniref:E3 ubiquitin-protein ligase parkin-like isoform X2 n=1 Tax=Acropora muricata TaxID=159855 RepID=UPI0034E383FC
MASARGSEKFPISVRFNSSTNIPVQADLQWRVSDLKQEIGKSQNVDPNELRIIFAGRELNNHQKLKDADIPNQSVIHAIRGGCWSSRSRRVQGTSLSQVVLTSVEEEEEYGARSGTASASGASQRKAQYFVYCKSPCKDITPGKLRVCCSRCKEGAMVLYQDFFFKCARHATTGEDRCVALPLIHSNTRDVPCLTCTEIKDPVLLFPCPDRHAMCLDCFEIYCTTKLNDRQFIHDTDLGYTLSCPGNSERCTDALIDEIHHFRVLGQQQYNRYQRFAAEECLLREGGVLCPRAGCGMGLFLEPGMGPVVTCSSCNLVFCKECKEPCRRGHSCSESQSNQATAAVGRSGYRVSAENARRARWEAEARRKIEEISKKCPGCKTNTEKNEGCNHMTCSQCRVEWCWICVKPWNQECRSSHWFHH